MEEAACTDSDREWEIRLPGVETLVGLGCLSSASCGSSERDSQVLKLSEEKRPMVLRGSLQVLKLHSRSSGDSFRSLQVLKQRVGEREAVQLQVWGLLSESPGVESRWIR